MATRRTSESPVLTRRRQFYWIEGVMECGKVLAGFELGDSDPARRATGRGRRFAAGSARSSTSSPAPAPRGRRCADWRQAGDWRQLRRSRESRAVGPTSARSRSVPVIRRSGFADPRPPRHGPRTARSVKGSWGGADGTDIVEEDLADDAGAADFKVDDPRDVGVEGAGRRRPVHAL